MAVAAAAALIFVAVWLSPPKAPDENGTAADAAAAADPFLPYLGEILKAIAGAISAFLTAAFIKGSEKPDGWVDALLSPVFANEGWGKKGRQKRAEAIARALG